MGHMEYIMEYINGIYQMFNINNKIEIFNSYLGAIAIGLLIWDKKVFIERNFLSLRR